MNSSRKLFLLVIGLAVVLSAWSVEPAEAAVKVGDKAIDFTLPTHDGRTLTLGKLQGKRGAVLVFFATWCPPCMAEVPHIKAFVEANRTSRILVYGLNVQQSKDVVQRFVTSRNINYRILLDSEGAVTRKYGVRGIPFIVGIDADGVIQHAGHSLPKDLAAFVEKLTAPLPKKGAEKAD